jgi:predicted DNA-binding transcriptional regulator YafY
MRADRLLATLLLLQNRGRVTAAFLAKELEVSIRTIYRDIDALSASGVPIYTDRGPGGGISLLESFRTDLTGLTNEEVTALFYLSNPSPLADLGLNQQIKGALIKLRSALPVSQNHEDDNIHQRLLLDWVGWHNTEEKSPFLRTVQQAVWHDNKLAIHYHFMIREQTVRQIISPYSLVAKAGKWYLIGASPSRIRVYQLSNIISVDLLSDKFERPSTYDLRAFWRDWCQRFEERRSLFRVQVRIHPNLLPFVDYIFGSQVSQNENSSSQKNPDRWIPMTLFFESFEAAREKILSCGRAVEVVAPYALRVSIIDYAKQIISFYRHQPFAEP